MYFRVGITGSTLTPVSDQDTAPFCRSNCPGGFISGDNYILADITAIVNRFLDKDCFFLVNRYTAQKSKF